MKKRYIDDAPGVTIPKRRIIGGRTRISCPLDLEKELTEKVADYEDQKIFEWVKQNLPFLIVPDADKSNEPNISDNKPDITDVVDITEQVACTINGLGNGYDAALQIISKNNADMQIEDTKALRAKLHKLEVQVKTTADENSCYQEFIATLSDPMTDISKDNADILADRIGVEACTLVSRIETLEKKNKALSAQLEEAKNSLEQYKADEADEANDQESQGQVEPKSQAESEGKAEPEETEHDFERMIEDVLESKNKAEAKEKKRVKLPCGKAINFDNVDLFIQAKRLQSEGFTAIETHAQISLNTTQSIDVRSVQNWFKLNW